MTLDIELDREEDGRWIAEVSVISGALVYGASREEAILNVQTLAREIIADEVGESLAGDVTFRYLEKGT